MEKISNNPVFQQLFILCLCVSLLIAQTSVLHLHAQHGDHSLTASGHVIDIHSAATLHDTANHHDGIDEHHHAAIDISQDSLLKKTSVLAQLAVIAFFFGLILCTPQLRYIARRWRYKPATLNACYLFQPPLRAPPVN